MGPLDSRDHVVVLLIGLLVTLAPALLLALTVGFLVLTGDLVLGRLTPLEFIELYIIDLLLFVGAGYGVYRLTLWTVENRLPASLDALEGRDDEELSNDGSDRTDSPGEDY